MKPTRDRPRRAVGAAAGGFLLALLLAALGCGGRSAPTAPSPAGPTTPYPPFSTPAFREAARITAVAGTEVLGTMQPGQFERDVKARIDAVFAREGSGPPAFGHLVQVGANAVDFHYGGDATELTAGELLVVDIGATSDGHCADMTRTFPIGGRFTARQREVYELVLAAQQAAAASVRMGTTSLATLDALVRDHLRASPLRARDANGLERTLDRFFTHSVGHYIGRAIHGEDTGWDPRQPLQPFQVLAVEPGVYIPGEGIGVRVEDTFLVTSLGLECLTCACPKEVSQIER